MLPHARDTERVGGRADRDDNSIIRQLKFINRTLTTLADHCLTHYHFSLHIYCRRRGFHIPVWKSNYGRPTHRRDVVPVAASARWRGVFRPSTRRCRRDRVGLMRVEVDFHTATYAACLFKLRTGCVMERYSTVPTAAPASIGVNRK